MMKTKRNSKKPQRLIRSRRSAVETLEARQLLCSIAGPENPQRPWDTPQFAIFPLAVTTAPNQYGLNVRNEHFSLWHDTQNNILPLLANDYDYTYFSQYFDPYGGPYPGLPDPNDQTPMQITSITAVYGTVQINNLGQVRYTPPQNFTGYDAIQYSVSNGIETVNSYTNLYVGNDPVVARKDPGYGAGTQSYYSTFGQHTVTYAYRSRESYNYSTFWSEMGVDQGDPTRRTEHWYNYNYYTGQTQSGTSTYYRRIFVNRNATVPFPYDVAQNDLDLDELSASQLYVESMTGGIGAVPEMRPMGGSNRGILGFRADSNVAPGVYLGTYEVKDGITFDVGQVIIEVVDGPVGGISGWVGEVTTPLSPLSQTPMKSDEGRLSKNTFYGHQFLTSTESETGDWLQYEMEMEANFDFANPPQVYIDSTGAAFNRVPPTYGATDFLYRGAGGFYVFARNQHFQTNQGVRVFIENTEVMVNYGDGNTSGASLSFSLEVNGNPNFIGYSCNGIAPRGLSILLVAKANLEHLYRTPGRFEVSFNWINGAITRPIDVQRSTLSAIPVHHPGPAQRVFQATVPSQLGWGYDTNLVDPVTSYSGVSEWIGSDGSSVTVPIQLVPTEQVPFTGNEPVSREFRLNATIPLVPTGFYTVNVSISDKEGDWTSFSMFVRVDPAPPVGVPDNYTMRHGDEVLVVPATTGLLANDNFYGATSSTLVGVTLPDRGILTLSTDGSFQYEREEGSTYETSFAYRPVSEFGIGNVVTVTILVTNVAPIASDFSKTVPPHRSTTIDFAASSLPFGFRDEDGDALQLVIKNMPVHGSLQFTGFLDGAGKGKPDLSVVYAPLSTAFPFYQGPDSFTYAWFDGVVESESATVQLELQNNEPTAVSFVQVVHPKSSTPIDFYNLGVPVEDFDSDGDPLELRVLVPPQHGNLVVVGTMNSDPPLSVVYVPHDIAPPYFEGADQFTYAWFDGVEESVPAVADLDVMNDLPTITFPQGGYRVLHDQSLLIDLSNVASDVNGDPISLTSVSLDPSFGTLTPHPTLQQQYIYQPPLLSVGSAELVVIANDGIGSTLPVKAPIVVFNTAPVAVQDNVGKRLSTPQSFDALNNDTDVDVPDLANLSIVSFVDPGIAGIDVTIENNMINVTAIPATFDGLVQIQYTISDGIATSSAALKVEFKDDPAELFSAPVIFKGSQSLVVNGPITLGSYLGRLPVYEPDGEQITYSVGVNNPISVDPDTGDLYLADFQVLNASAATDVVVPYTATDPSGQSVTGSLTITLPAKPSTVSDAFVDSGSHRTGITFDLRPTSVSVAGETLYTTLLDAEGNPIAPESDPVPVVIDQFTVGHYVAGLDGVLRFNPVENLYATVRNINFANQVLFNFDSDTGISKLVLPLIDLVLVALDQATGTPDILAERKATPTLTNTEPIAVDSQSATAPVRFLASEGKSLKVLPDDLLSFDLSAFFFDPDGDPIYASNPVSTRAGQLEFEPGQLGLETLIVDIVGDRESPNGNIGLFSDSVLSVDITDVDPFNVGIPGTLLGKRLVVELENQNLDNRNGQYHLPEGITRASDSVSYIQNWSQERQYAVIRPDTVLPQGNRVDPDYRWKWGKWKLSEQNGYADRNSDNFVARGPVAFDPVGGSFVTSVDLGLDDELQGLPILLGSLVYDSNSVSSTVYSHITVERPAGESRQIHGFRVSVSHLDDRFSGQPFFVANATQQFTLPVTGTLNDRKFELTVPVLDTADPNVARLIRGSGVYAYEVTVEPIFDSNLNNVGTGTADSYPLSVVGRVPLVRNVSVTHSDARSAWQTTEPNRPLFGDGWQLSGLPQLVIDRGDPLLTEFLHDGTVTPTDSISRPTVLLQMPGSDRVSVFRANEATAQINEVTFEAETYNLSGMTFNSIDVRTNLRDPEEFGTLTVNSDLELVYDNGFGTKYVFSRFNQSATAGSTLQAAPHYAVTKILPPNENGISISYIDDSSLSGTVTPLVPVTDSTGSEIDGFLKLHQITASQQNGASEHHLTFRYNAAKQVEKIVFADGREVILGYTNSDDRPQLTSIDQFGLHTVTLGYADKADSQSDEPLLDSITYARSSTIDDLTAWKFKNGAVDEIYRGGTSLTTAKMVTKLDSIGERIRTSAGQGSAAVTGGPGGGPLLEPAQGDLHRRDRVVSSVRVADWSDSQIYVGGSNPVVNKHGFHVSTHYLDDAANALIVDTGFAPGQLTTDPSSLVDVAQQRSLYDFDGRNYQIAVVDPLGRKTVTIYDHSHHQGQLSEGLTANHPKARGLPVLTGSPQGWTKIERVTHDDESMGKPRRIVDPLGRESLFFYSEDDGQLLRQRDARKIDDVVADRWTETEFDSEGRLEYVKNPLGLEIDVTVFDPDDSRLPKTVVTTSPAGPGYAQRQWTTETIYDDFGYVDTVTTTENGLVVSFEDSNYDALGRLINYQLKESATGLVLRNESYSYDSLGRQISKTDGRNAVHETAYDAAGRVHQTIAAFDAKYDPASIAGTTEYEIQHETNFIYYADGSLKQRTLPDGTTVKIYRDSAVELTPDEKVQSPSTAVTTARYGTQTWTVTSGVSSGDGVVDQTTRSRMDELGRVVYEDNFLTFAEHGLISPH
jgi:hypothetical protein